MAIQTEDLIEAFQKSEKFEFGARTIDFYQRLGFSENDIRELLETNKKVLYGRENYIIGLTRDLEKKTEYVTIIPYSEDSRKISLMTRKIATNIVKNIKSNRRY